MNPAKTRFVILIITLLLTPAAICAPAHAPYRAIAVPETGHPALDAAARIIADTLGATAVAIERQPGDRVPTPGRIVLAPVPLSDAQQAWAGDVAMAGHDGYVIRFKDGAAMICGNRPRSFLYAAGDVHLWHDRTDGVYRRDPSFALRTTEHHGSMPMPEYVAALGMNLLIDRKARTSVCLQETLPEVYRRLSEDDQQRLSQSARAIRQRQNALRQACHDADIAYYTFLYGNNMQRWSDPLYQAALKAFPSAAGTPAANSWEKATLCPSDPKTWDLVDAYLRDYMAQTQADGLYVTFWDDYGIYCQCDRCRATGMNTFPNQLHTCVRQYHQTLRSLGKKLIVRTWSSGVPHWFKDEWVHAPGYDHFGGSGTDLWGRVFKELPDDIIIQTKVYHADCQPAPRFSTLLGQAGDKMEIAEYQMTGQTTGRYYFPASTVDHTAWTIRQSHALLGADAGVNLFLGGTRQTNYFLLDDILNSINAYAWRELSWNVDADLDQLWADWAARVYGEQAAPFMARAIRLSEDAVNGVFSTLGLGSSTNSDFARTIARRETLLMYTNRHFLPEYAGSLAPTPETIRRVIDEKDDCLRKIDQMFAEFDKARPYLTAPQIAEIQTRFDWLKAFAVNKRYLEESLFRFRYLRHLNALRTTDPDQLVYIEQAFDQIRQHHKKLFQFDPALQFACYDTTLGQLDRTPSLGSPVPLMRDLYEQSKRCLEEIVGPHYRTNRPAGPVHTVGPGGP